ncbi:MAG: hypothetical protein AAFV07_12800 [Bacteroidota bacterium]
MKRRIHFLRGHRPWQRGFLCLLCSCRLLFSSAWAQSKPASPPPQGRWAIQVGLGVHSVGFPLQNLGAGFRPAITDVGLEFRMIRGPKHQLSLATQSTFVFNDVIGNSLLTGLSLQYAYTHRLGVVAGVDLNLGSLLQWYPRETLHFDPVDGKYSSQPGEIHQNGHSGFGLMLGYDLESRYELPLVLFVRNKFYIQPTYFQTGAFPVMPQNILALGVKIKLAPRNKS